MVERDVVPGLGIVPQFKPVTLVALFIQKSAQLFTLTFFELSYDIILVRELDQERQNLGLSHVLCSFLDCFQEGRFYHIRTQSCKLVDPAAVRAAGHCKHVLHTYLLIPFKVSAFSHSSAYRAVLYPFADLYNALS